TRDREAAYREESQRARVVRVGAATQTLSTRGCRAGNELLEQGRADAVATMLLLTAHVAPRPFQSERPRVAGEESDADRLIVLECEQIDGIQLASVNERTPLRSHRVGRSRVERLDPPLQVVVPDGATDLQW